MPSQTTPTPDIPEVVVEGQDQDVRRKKELEDLLFSKHYRITGRVVLIILGSVGVVGGLGFLCDMILGTKPWGLLAGVLLSFFVAQAITIYVFHKLTK